MGIMDKLMFWKKEPDLGDAGKGLEDLGGGPGSDSQSDMGGNDPYGSAGVQGAGGQPGSQGGPSPQGMETGYGMGKDDLGLGQDPTAGLGGTSEIPSNLPDSSAQIGGGQAGGQGAQQAQGQQAPQGAGQQQGGMRSAPLERKPVHYQEIPQSQQGSQGGGYGSQGGQGQGHQRDVSKDLEVISSKLDSIKSMLDMINHRLDGLERQQNKRGRMEW
ncbi:MAG: hypothetical protein R6U32_05175 [Candidatus Woesearchaeota archaeon]